MTLRGVELGAGQPKICVPLTGATVDELLAQVERLPAGRFDLVELRIDYLERVDERRQALDAAEAVRAALPDSVPLLFTFRSAAEGGQRELDLGDYERLLTGAIATRAVDAIDVEMFTELGVLERIVNAAHEAGVVVVMSSHDFHETPPLDQIVARLTLQQDLGADVVKIAVMPTSPRDVLTLLEATDEFRQTKGVRPAITMAMGPLGVVSRLSGEIFGSCLTFGSVGDASAPGQVPVEGLQDALGLVHAAQPAPVPGPPATVPQPEDDDVSRLVDDTIPYVENQG
ncbi:type I 3-dehydroquinate dehydratase [Frondihabitans cladoniiphilus]|uniref:3-dehydroquinate dehydratase n=1 Tax=Frondihabitans cladoniiphilus TaxID=715785 RepID=A0ABP8W6B1_9MICO